MKVLFVLLICTLFSFCAFSQTGFFGKLKKPPKPTTPKGIISKTFVTPTDSTFGAIRPTIIPAAFSITSGRISAGAGFGYKNITYTYPTVRPDGTEIPGRFYTNWSINIVGLMGGNIAPTTPAMAASYGLTVGLLNDIVNVGVEFNSRKEEGETKFKLKADLILSYTIVFNN